MALFLESVNVEANDSSLEEMLQEGIELSMEYAQLNEAIMIADFTLHERNRNLEESVRVLKEENFVSKAWTTLKVWVKKAWLWIKATAKKYWEVVKSLYNRVKDHVTGDTLVRSKAAIARAEWTIKYSELMAGHIEKLADTDSVEGVQSVVEKAKSTMEAKQKKHEEIKNMTGTTKVSKTYLAKIEENTAAMYKTLEKAGDKITKHMAEMDKKAAAGTSGNLQSSKEIGEAARAIRLATASIKSYSASTLGSLLTALKGLTGGDAADKK